MGWRSDFVEDPGRSLITTGGVACGHIIGVGAATVTWVALDLATPPPGPLVRPAAYPAGGGGV